MTDKPKPKRYTADQIDDELKALGELVEIPIDVYMIGGGAMSIREIKDSTKDVDLVIPDEDQYNEFVRVLKESRYEQVRDIAGPYTELDIKIFWRDDLSQFDLFQRRVCKKYLVHEYLLERAQLHAGLGRITVYLCSNEDIFMMKAATNRDSDIDDMYRLYTQGLDEGIIIGECAFQTEHAQKQDMVWETYLIFCIEKMEEKYDVSVPWKLSLLLKRRKRRAT
jgi:uncharacterized nucleotidyltransferase DUF6036